MSEEKEQQVLIVLSQLNKNKNTLADVKKIEKMFWGDADVMATTELSITTTKKWAEKYMPEVKKLADEKGYDLDFMELDTPTPNPEEGN